MWVWKKSMGFEGLSCVYPRRCHCAQPRAQQSSPYSAQVALAEAQQTGFHIKRNEFEQGYDPEAECIISEMEFKYDYFIGWGHGKVGGEIHSTRPQPHPSNNNIDEVYRGAGLHPPLVIGDHL